MAASNEPLHEHEVGSFGELAQRPNPDDLVILSVPPVEERLAVLRQQFGRELTSEEVEIHRRQSPSIVVNRMVAEKMAEERSARPPAAPAKAASRVPTLCGAYNAMPTEQAARAEAARDVFGQHLFSLRNRLVERLRRVIESEEIRMRLGALHRKEYDAVAALAPAERDAAISLAGKTIDLYMQDVLALFTGKGMSNDLRFGDGHATSYRLVLEVKEIESDQIVEEFDINRQCKKVFYEYYGRWLNRFGSHR